MKKLKILSISILATFLFSSCGNKEIIKNQEQSKKASIENNTVLQDKNSKHIEKKDIEKNNPNSKEINNEKNNNLNNRLQDSQKKENINKDNSKVEENKDIKYSSGDRLKSKTIVIDPGHASKADINKEPEAPNSSNLKYKQTGGADGIITKTPEYEVNMKVAKKLQSILQAKGYNVIMTKTDNNKVMSNIERAKIGNNAKADLVIRIHADSAESSSPKGASILVPAKNNYTKGFYNDSKNFGKIILSSLVNQVGMKSRGIIERGDITGFNWSTVPVVLVEMGFLSNPQEDKLLSSNQYQQKIAEGIAKGIQKIYSSK